MVVLSTIVTRAILSRDLGNLSKIRIRSRSFPVPYYVPTSLLDNERQYYHGGRVTISETS
ncbi:hypothetical protein KIN20_027211 [Parelaphostrongylus tenuis]|uniref:Uncharacterized protein n=1 Tax=Parelaphostrongylus tenuis TaxID=148309 RepID=A0AAD5WDM1_PARTN|nr:hypothetical protein KIN20_027211 [Parelaphostrongylus tenuis]